jgi:enolase-phosphatase E1
MDAALYGVGHGPALSATVPRSGVSSGIVTQVVTPVVTPQVRLLDIEGTVAPIDFVHQTLFPYARQRIPTFLAQPLDLELRDAMESLSVERQREVDTDGVPADNAGYLLWLMDRDRKSGPLKIVQGRIWQQGYESGTLVSELFPDVPNALRRWTSAGQRVAIFSSGSILAQRLVFRYTRFGDLTRFIDAYFDTSTGPKRDPESYRAIAARLETPPDEIQFFSDVIEELDAAALAQMRTVVTVRPGNREIAPGVLATHSAIRSLDEIP